MLLIINPVSGRGVLHYKLWRILKLFSDSNIATQVLFTKKRGDALEYAKNCPDTIKTVVCAGGDGTLNEVISGLMENPYPHFLGYIPAGTTNDLATSLGISKDAVSAAKGIITGTPKKIDIGLFSNRYFNYIASFGAFTESSYNAPQEAKNILGHFAYILEGIMSIANIRPQKAKFTFDGNVVEGDFIFAAISNTTSMGGVLKLKDALVGLNDGLFEVILVRSPKNLNQLQKIISEILSQKFSGDLVQLHHASEITVESEEDIDWTLDGECHHGGTFEHIQNIKGGMSFILPHNTKIDQV